MTFKVLMMWKLTKVSDFSLIKNALMNCLYLTKIKVGLRVEGLSLSM